MASSTIPTLQHMTIRKLKQLDFQRKKFEADKELILNQASAEPILRCKVEALLDGFELYGILPKQADLYVANLRQFAY
jgi:hypothetical protein